MKRICLVSYTNIYMLPYAQNYIKWICENNAECNILYWDRDGDEDKKSEQKGVILRRYKKKTTSKTTKVQKLMSYVEVTRFFRKNLKAEKFDGLIFLQTHCAIACSDFLKKYYKEKYIVDIRDFTLENIGIYKSIEKKIIINSYTTVISSPAYADFLPKYNYYIAHNYTAIIDSEQRFERTESTPIRISFIGTVRFIDNDKKLLKIFANDNRFRINYFGIGSDVLEKYCAEEEIKNVSFEGKFEPNQLLNLYEDTDIINNIYGNHNSFLDFALSNKLYHAAQLEMPILVCKDTYMEKVIKEYNMGFVFDYENLKIKDEIYKYYNSLKWSELQDGSKRLLEKVRSENGQYKIKIVKFIQEV